MALLRCGFAFSLDEAAADGVVDFASEERPVRTIS